MTTMIKVRFMTPLSFREVAGGTETLCQRTCGIGLQSPSPLEGRGWAKGETSGPRYADPHPSPLPGRERGIEKASSPMSTIHSHPRARRRAVRKNGSSGFSMLELTTAMGLFAIGLVAVASIFPVATLLQKQATNDTMSDQVASNVRALMQARPYPHTVLHNNMPGDVTTNLFVNAPMVGKLTTTVDPTGSPATYPLWHFWMLVDRSFPSSITTPNDRQYFWVPLARRLTSPATTKDDWQVFAFILKKEQDTYGPKGGSLDWGNYYGPPAVPGVFRVNVTIGSSSQSSSRFDFTTTGYNADSDGDGRQDEIDTGDQILDNNGIIHNVLDATANSVTVLGQISQFPVTPTALWYGKPAAAGDPSPTAQIIIVPDAVE